MKRTQFKDALRNIWKQKVAYLSAIVIALLGVTTFLGVNYAYEALKKNSSNMYNAANFRDIEIMSTVLLTEDDLEAIAKTDGVADAEAVWQTSAKAEAGEKKQDVTVITRTERINLPDVIEGRLPAAAGECAVEQGLAQEMGWRVGDEVQLSKAAGDAYLANDRFSIVGIANHPDHTSVSIPEPLYLIATRDDFDTAALDGCFMKAEVVIDRPADVDRFGAKYESAVDAVTSRLDALAGERASIRDDEIKERMSARLDDAQSQLDDALEQLQTARVQLDDGWKALGDGEKQIEKKKIELTDAQSQLEAAWKLLQDAAKQLEVGQRKLDEAGTQLVGGRSALRKGKKQLDTAKEELIKAWDQLEDAKEAVRSAIRSRLGSAANYVNWAGRKKADLNNPDQRATDFWVTSSVKFDLNESLTQNITKLVHSSAIPDDALIDLYVRLTGGDQ